MSHRNLGPLDATEVPSVDDLLTPQETARRLGVSTKTLSNWRNDRCAPSGPEPLRIGGRIYYRPEALLADWNSQTGVL